MGWLDLLPTPAKLYASTVAGGNREPITEADFTPEELQAMQQLIASAKTPGQINYGDYAQNEQPGMMGMLNAKGRVANSLGQFNYQDSPEGATVTDNYDFNPMFKNESALLNLMSALGTGGFSPMHLLGEYLVPPGKGRPVRIKLPKRSSALLGP